MKYDEYSYLWPPRPEDKTAPGFLPAYENRGWWAQKKKNGTCTVIFACGNEVIFKTRHLLTNDGNHRAWTPKEEHTRFFQGFSKWHVFVAELLHSKVPGIRDQLYIHDIIVKDGVQLVNTTFAERQEMLHAMWKGKDEPDQVRINAYVTLAKCFKTGFAAVFKKLGPEDEGLVLKNPKGKLSPCFTPDANKRWQVKSRIATKNYSY